MIADQHAQQPQPAKPWRLRTRLALALLIIFVPVSALIVISHLEGLSGRRDSEIENYQALGGTVAALIDGYARDLESFTLSVTTTFGEVPLEAVDQGNNPGIQPYLARLQENYGNLRAVFVTDTSGVVVASSATGVGVDVSSRNYIQALQRGADTAWSGAVPGLQSGQTTLAFARAIKSPQGEVHGFFVVAFYPQQLVRRLPPELPEIATVSLVDDRGALLFRSDYPPPSEPPPVDPEPPQSIADWPVYQRVVETGAPVALYAEESPLSSGKRYGALIPLEHTGWTVGVSVPKDVVDGPLQSRLQRDLFVIFGALALGFAMMLYIAHRLSQPISRLSGVAAAIAAGEHPTIPDQAEDADVQRLSRSMQAMSDAINEREDRLASQSRILQTLDRVGQALATELDFGKVAESLSQAGLEITQATTVALFHRAGAQHDQDNFELLSLAGQHGPFPLRNDDPLMLRTFDGETIYVSDLHRPAGANPSDSASAPAGDVRSFLGIPVFSRSGGVQGGLFLLSTDANAFDTYQLGLAAGLGRRASIVVENARLYSQARETQEQLRRAAAAKDEFLALISHELRTPITTIYGGSRLLRGRRKSLPEDSIDEMVTSIEEEAERLYRLVEDLLAIARADLSEEIRGEPTAIVPSLEQVVKQFASRRPGRPIDMRAAPGLPPVLAEMAYLRQIVTNLLSNADKYSEAGLPIDVEVTAGGDECQIKVLDRGPGVLPEEIDQIFDSFYRSPATARQASGKGLGLTVCKRLAEAMSGRIWAAPREGGGLEVGFSLPLAIDADSVEPDREKVQA